MELGIMDQLAVGMKKDSDKLTAQELAKAGGLPPAVAESLLQHLPTKGQVTQFRDVNDAVFDKMTDQASRKQLDQLVTSNPQVAGQLAAFYRQQGPTAYKGYLDNFVAAANKDPGLAAGAVEALQGNLTPGKANPYTANLAGYLSHPDVLDRHIERDQARLKQPSATVAPAAVVASATVATPEKPKPSPSAQKSDKGQVDFLAESKKMAAASAGPQRPEDVMCTAETDPATGLPKPLDTAALLDSVLLTGGATAVAAAPGKAPAKTPPPVSATIDSDLPPAAPAALTSAEALAVFDDAMKEDPAFRKQIKDHGLEEKFKAALEKNPNAAKNLQDPAKLKAYTSEIEKGHSNDLLATLSGDKIPGMGGMGGMFGGLGDMISQMMPGIGDWVKGMGEMVSGMLSHMFTELKGFFGIGEVKTQGTGNAFSKLLGGVENIFNPSQPVTQVKNTPNGDTSTVRETSVAQMQAEAEKAKYALVGAGQQPTLGQKIDPAHSLAEKPPSKENLFSLAPAPVGPVGDSSSG